MIQRSRILSRGSIVAAALAGTALLACLGCSDDSPIQPSTRPADYVGEYVLHVGKGDHVKYADVLILKADRNAVGVRYSDETGQVLTSKLTWDLNRTGTENVVIGDYAYPVSHFGPKTKLSVNDDDGLYYEKVR